MISKQGNCRNIKNDNNVNIKRLILGRSTSAFGEAFFLITLPLFVLGYSDSLAVSGGFFTIASIPAIIITPFLGVMVERVNKKKLIICCDLCTSLIYTGLAVMCGTKSRYLILLLAGVMVIKGCASFFDIASKVMFSELLDSDSMQKYNALKSFCDTAVSMIAPAVGTLVYGIMGFRTVLVVSAVLYACSALQECRIEYIPPNCSRDTCGNDRRAGLKADECRKTEWGEVSSEESGKCNVRRELKEGISYVLGNREILALFLLVMTLNFFVANDNEIIFPGILIQRYHISEKLYGFSTASFITGTLLAGIFIFKNHRLELFGHMNKLFLANAFCMSLVSIFAIILYPDKTLYFIVFMILEMVIGFITSCVNVPLSSYFQTRIPLSYQGRFFGLLSFSANLLIPLGITWTGFMASCLGAETAYLLNNAGVIAAVLLLRRKKKR